jgi:alkyl sulfatase BDS1-like metallo-beta-lactamase superfamily hydrolase
VSSNPALAEQSKTMQDEIADLLQAPPLPAPPAAPPTVARNTDVAAIYKAADDAFKGGQYDRAIQLLQRIVAVDSGNQAARLLLEQVRAAKKEEEDNAQK